MQPVSEKAGVSPQRNGKFIDNNEREKRGKEAETRSRVVGLGRSRDVPEGQPTADCNFKVVGLGRSRDVPEGQPTADCNFKANTHESVIHEEKEIRADGGCLGFRRRRRTRQAAKMHGEPQAGTDPCVSEWGNPAGRSPVTGESRGERGELKHLSTRRRRKKTIDCRSSGERTGRSPNRRCRGSVGVVGAAIGSS